MPGGFVMRRLLQVDVGAELTNRMAEDHELHHGLIHGGADNRVDIGASV